MKDKLLLLGDEAIAQGALDAGLSGVYAYPGTPSTEITEYIQGSSEAKERKVHCQWSSNEKTAMEAALGMSYVGKRSMVCMKHVGMNVAADAFVNAAMSGVNGGLVVVAADDPSMHSSQNEQDSRFYGKFAMIPVFEPSTQQEAYDLIKRAFDVSERFKVPVLFRMVTRLAHSRAVVTLSEAREENKLSYPTNPRQWVLMPLVAKVRYKELIAQQEDFLKDSESLEVNKYIDGTDNPRMPKFKKAVRPDVHIAENFHRAAIRARLEQARQIALKTGSAFVRVETVPITLLVVEEWIKSFAPTEEKPVPEITFVPLSYYVQQKEAEK